MAQDNGYAFFEVQEDGTKPICIDCWFKAQPGHEMSFDTRPKPDREAMWVHCKMHHSRMGHTTTNRGLGVRSTTAIGLAGGLVATGSITVPEVIDDYIGDDVTKAQNTHARENSAPPHVVLTNDDLLTKILIRLPILSIYLFTTVSKQWLRILTSLVFTLNCSQIIKVDPSTNQFKRLPHPDCSLDNSLYYRSAGLRMAFDLTKSPHYKLVDAGCTSCDIDIQIYSSETGNYRLCRDRFNYFSFDHFDSAIYLNDALQWLETENRQLSHPVSGKNTRM
ncbi:ribonuclease H-like domain-containing protein [Tanacetum coccineum]